jgi:heptosyltransferase-1
MASWSTKLWPEAAWRRLLEALDARGLAIVLPWGNGEERERAERLADGLAKALVLPRVLDGPALASLLSGARLAIGLDTGLMHLANAFDVPGVWLYGPTDPALSGPYGDRQSVLRSPHPSAPCGQRHCSREPSGACCMNAIAMEAVLAAVAARLHG